MSSFDPTQLLEMLEKAREQNFCPNRIWQFCSQIGDWPSKQLIAQEILDELVSKDALKHENHSACNVDFCEFSIRNFTAVQQYHEPMSNEEGDQTKIAENHKQQGTCVAVRGLFNETKLVQAVQSDKLTAWSLDGWDILEYPRPFMALSHVWSDGTGTGSWESKRVNTCLYNYLKRIARKFQCEGIWWDAICIPQDKGIRSKAISIMDRNYEYARVTLVHDRFLRNLPFEGPERACLAIVLSSWFTRGWTALELTRSHKVKIIFQDSIRDLDEEILYKNGTFAAKIIKDLRNDRFSDIGDLLAALKPRYTSWLKDRAIIAGLLAGIRIPDTDKDTFQQDIYQRILKGIGEISYDHLFHNSVTMTKGFNWCAANLFQLPQATTQHRLKINTVGEVFGSWRLYSVNQIYPKCLWDKSHELVEAKLKYALRIEAKKHVLLVKPPPK
ncbi:hypothetical protein F4679DRAFT_412202 [Xylaria curta]|nr:hypothetical protein F4679DRAFT_412202 [Xylaria curta]